MIKRHWFAERAIGDQLSKPMPESSTASKYLKHQFSNQLLK